ncbi:hypothetical protein AAFF_G00069980 [Aldrovandia affinis]|uniref:Uncharacterized protein n=1 Tax=Aldrovandia affinis TaxID=143900 RepID=A0AAD7RYU5_9TELE|nr:hypothetical protein AAFF_G00069980 [Aldrovandia affinis]
MDSVVKKSLAAPIRQFTCCVSRAKDSDGWASRNTKNLKGGKGKSAPSKPTKAASDPPLVRSYLADLEKERQADLCSFAALLFSHVCGKRRAGRNAQKNAERAAMRAHYRRKHQLSKSCKDANHLKAVAGKVVLPRELAAMVRPEPSSKDEGYSIFDTFQGLNLNLGMLTGNTQSKTPANAEQCRVM